MVSIYSSVITGGELEKAKASLLSQLALLESICNEFTLNVKIHVATERMAQWRNQTEEILSRLGKQGAFVALAKIIVETVPVYPERISTEKKKYRAFLLRIIREIEDRLSQINDEPQAFVACTD